MSDNHETTFHGLRFATAPGRVFTPRPTTEALVDEALSHVDGKPLRVADAGTGSGAVAVALAARAPAIQVWATDTSRAAVELARVNAARHGVDDRVHVVEGNLLDPLEGKFDLIVANLPYLPDRFHRAEYEDEPDEAVYAPGDGLVYYRRLLDACKDGKLVTPGGRVVLQFHRDVLAADCWELEELRERLEERQARAA
jgi:release factor glutamine methyltransferase